MKWLKRLFGGFDPSLKELTDDQMSRIWGAGSGGGGQSGETRYNWNPYMENMWAGGQDGNTGLLGRALNTLNSPYQRYGGDRVADLTFDQENAGNLIRHIATNGAPDTNAARDQNMRTSRGEYLNANPWSGAEVKAERNSFSGNSPQFDDMLQSGIGDIAEGYEKGTAADTQRAFAQANAFGGSAHNQAVEGNSRALGKTMADFTGSMRNEQFNRSAGLEDSFQNRNLQAQNINKQIGSQNWENERGRMLQGSQLGLQGQGLGFEAGRQMMGVGDIYRNYNQQNLDDQFRDWSGEQDWERNNLNWMANLLGQAQGSTGSTQTFGGYGGGVNPIAGLLGAAALGRGMQLY